MKTTAWLVECPVETALTGWIYSSQESAEALSKSVKGEVHEVTLTYKSPPVAIGQTWKHNRSYCSYTIVAESANQALRSSHGYFAHPSDTTKIFVTEQVKSPHANTVRMSEKWLHKNCTLEHDESE